MEDTSMNIEDLLSRPLDQIVQQRKSFRRATGNVKQSQLQGSVPQQQQQQPVRQRRRNRQTTGPGGRPFPRWKRASNNTATVNTFEERLNSGLGHGRRARGGAGYMRGRKSDSIVSMRQRPIDKKSGARFPEDVDMSSAPATVPRSRRGRNKGGAVVKAMRARTSLARHRLPAVNNAAAARAFAQRRLIVNQQIVRARTSPSLRRQANFRRSASRASPFTRNSRPRQIAKQQPQLSMSPQQQQVPQTFTFNRPVQNRNRDTTLDTIKIVAQLDRVPAPLPAQGLQMRSGNVSWSSSPQQQQFNNAMARTATLNERFS